MRAPWRSLVIAATACGRIAFDHVDDGAAPPIDEAPPAGCVRQLFGSNEFTCALLSDGTVACWGYYLVLGTGAQQNDAVPRKVPGVSGAIAIGGGVDHMCVLHDDHTLSCWGRNDTNQLGALVADPQLVPARVPGVANVIEVRGGQYHTCIRTQTGAVACWGANNAGQLGPAPTSQTASPVVVTGLPEIQQIAAGQYCTCALATDRTVWCWGANDEGQLGIDTGGVDNPTPTQVPGLPPILAIAAGLAQVCALATDGTVWCWGENDTGQLGDNTTTSRAAPGRVIGMSDVVEIGTGSINSPGPGGSSCARRSDGTVWCWGWNQFGQLGNGQTGDRHVPVAVNGIDDANLLFSALVHTCVRRATGALACWGRNAYGQLGTGSFSSSTTAQPALLQCP